MAIGKPGATWWPLGLLLGVLLAGCERDRTLEQPRDGVPEPTAADPAAAHRRVDLVQDRGRGSWAVLALPEVPEPEPPPAADGAPPAEPPPRQSPFPPVEGLDEAIAAVPLLLQQTPAAMLAQGDAPGFTTGRGDLVLQLEDRPEPPPADGRPKTATPDRLLMTLDVAGDGGPTLRIEPVQTVRLTEHGAYAAWGPWPSIYGAWFVGNVVVDQRTVDRNHLMYVHAEPVAGSASAGEADSPTYAVHVVVLPVLIEGTVPQMQELAAIDRLTGAAPAEEEPGAAEAPDDEDGLRALHLVLQDAHRERRETTATRPR